MLLVWESLQHFVSTDASMETASDPTSASVTLVLLERPATKVSSFSFSTKQTHYIMLICAHTHTHAHNTSQMATRGKHVTQELAQMCCFFKILIIIISNATFFSCSCFFPLQSLMSPSAHICHSPHFFCCVQYKRPYSAEWRSNNA